MTSMPWRLLILRTTSLLAVVIFMSIIMIKLEVLMTELELKIANASKVELHYKPPYEYRYAVVEYCCRKGRPLRVAEYYIYGEELKTGKPLICWSWIDSTNFNIVEDNFSTEEEAKTRMKELRLQRKNIKE
jgi:hypothetical protein